MAAMSTLSPPKLAHLINSISSLFHLLHRRLYSILSGPALYSLTLRHLQSLPLEDKSLLIARHFLSNLAILTHLMQSSITDAPKTYLAINPPFPMKLRDIDAVVLLLLLCEIRHLYPEMLETPPSNLRPILYNYISREMLTLSGIEASGAHVLTKYVEMVGKCKQFVGVMGGDGGGKGANVSATSVAVVVTLPSLEVRSSSNAKECVICKEEMQKGRDVCELPCDHLFHWMCILPWLKKNNTCPCCRYSLPTDDVYSEIERLWELLAKTGSGC